MSEVLELSHRRDLVDGCAAPQGRSRGVRIPPNVFGISFGLAGLAESWHATEPILRTPQAIPNALSILAAVIWSLVTVAYLAQGPRRALADLRDPVLSPFVPVATITGMLLAAALGQYEAGIGRVFVIVFLAITIAIGGWLTGQWIAGDVDPGSMHPGYFLPTVAGGMVGAFSAAQVHLHALAELSFGVGLICWLLLGSVLLNRLFFRSSLPAPLVPTLAIEIAPPVVAGVAYTALTGHTSGPFAFALAGYAVLMAIVQLRFLPLFVRQRFGLGFWAFTFSYAAAATDALEWVASRHPVGATVYATVTIASISALVLAIAIRTVVAVARGQLPKYAPSTPQGAPGDR